MSCIDFYQNQFYQVVSRSRAAVTGAALSGPRDNQIITEMVNGVIVSRPAKKYANFDSSSSKQNSEPEVTELGGSSKAGSIYGNNVNKARQMNDFIISKGIHW